MAASVLMLFAALVVGACVWLLTLRLHGMPIPWHIALSSHGLSVFGKYVPGRVWAVLGRASRLATAGFPLAKTSMLSLKAQLISIWVGFAIGLAPALVLQERSTPALVALTFVVGTGPFLLSSRLQHFVLRRLGHRIHRKLAFPPLPVERTALLFAGFAMSWLLYTAGFGLFLRALQPHALVRAAFSFPLAMNIGLLAVFVPGGLGVREGVMTGLLLAAGFDTASAMAAALLSRLWFTAGEVFIFLCGFMASARHRGWRIASTQEGGPVPDDVRETDPDGATP